MSAWTIKVTQQMLKGLLLIMGPLVAEKELGSLMAGHHLRTRQKQWNKLMKVMLDLHLLFLTKIISFYHFCCDHYCLYLFTRILVLIINSWSKWFKSFDNLSVYYLNWCKLFATWKDKVEKSSYLIFIWYLIWESSIQRGGKKKDQGFRQRWWK